MLALDLCALLFAWPMSMTTRDRVRSHADGWGCGRQSITSADMVQIASSVRVRYQSAVYYRVTTEYRCIEVYISLHVLRNARVHRITDVCRMYACVLVSWCALSRALFGSGPQHSVLCAICTHCPCPCVQYACVCA